MIYIYLPLIIILLAIILIAYFGSSYLMARRKPDPAASPKDVGLEFEEVTFQTSDKIKIGGWYVPARNSIRTIIVCPGANGSIDSDVEVLPWLCAAGFNVLMFDWRAHGRSAGKQVSLGFYERYDLIAAIDFAKAKGAHKIGVLGFSLGGAIVLTVAAAIPAIDAVAADSAIVDMVSAVKGSILERSRGWLKGDLLAHLFLLVASLRLGVREFVDPLAGIDRISPRPILLIYGDKDPYVPPTEIAALIDRAKQPTEVWRVPEAAHRNIHELRPGEYRTKIVYFFDRNL